MNKISDLARGSRVGELETTSLSDRVADPAIYPMNISRLPFKILKIPAMLVNNKEWRDRRISRSGRLPETKAYFCGVREKNNEAVSHQVLSSLRIVFRFR